ncbi:ATP-binding protein [Streptomyces zhihengii]|uniref:ATP-binding protein n=1 Tax=Streptomyces zhihengii TaxID=1818004 RepID=UPI001FD380D9|nr:ATP-binding protein [Streptomyces zhihengii]
MFRESGDGQNGLPRAQVALDGSGACIGQARDAAAAFLAREWDEGRFTVSKRTAELTGLVVSELVTNAIKYAPGPVLLDLLIAEDTVEVSVWDTDPVLPAARAADPARVGQHGLEIVTAVARRMSAVSKGMGKCITVALALADDTTPRTA